MRSALQSVLRAVVVEGPRAVCPNLEFHECRVGFHLLEALIVSKTLKIKIYRTTILPVVLYGCETWSLTLREERKLRVSDNMVLRRIFGPRRDEITGDWRRLHNEELNDLYSSPNIVRVIIEKNEMGWACGAYG